MAIRFSIIGCGHIGRRHAGHIQGNSKARLKCVFDINSDKGELVARDYDAKCAQSIEDLLSTDTDIVCVCTPSGHHKEHSIACLRAGKHVLVEKPMALSVSDAQDMVNASLTYDRELFVVKQNRYNPPIQRLKEEIEKGTLGEIFQVHVNCFWNRNEAYYTRSEWKGSKSLDGGVLWNQFSHFIDIAYYLFGGISGAQGIVANKNHGKMTEFEDSGTFNFQYKNGAIGSINFTTNTFKQNMEGSITIFSKNATIKIGGKYLNAVEYFQSDSFDMENLPLSAPANNYGYYEGSMSNHDKVIENVVETLLGKSKIMTSSRDGLEVVKMIEQLYNSAKWI